MSKSIDICKASLVSLKAELLRKQDEANKAKSFSGDTFIRPIPGAKTPSCLLQSNEGVQKRNAKDMEQEFEPSIDNSLKKSRDILAMKSLLYDKLVSGEMIPEQDKTFLVNFKQKVNDVALKDCSTLEKKEKICNSDVELDKFDFGDDDDWVDYTDFFGRTRRCLKVDLEFFKKRDQRIENELGPPPNNIKSNDISKEQKFVKEGMSSVNESELNFSDMRREQLRLKWEEEERKLADRTDIHYEDIRFDEVREHGVGYYAFSTDEKERHRQQAELKKIREETKETQSAVQKLKEKRAAQMAARLKAVKRRKKEKLGLPLDSSSDEEQVLPPKSPSPEIIEDIKAQQAFEKLRKAAHVRPWDYGKDGVQKPLMTQDEWNEKQRSERRTEFSWDYSETSKSVSKSEHSSDEDDMVGPSLDMFTKSNNIEEQCSVKVKNYNQPIKNELDDESNTTKSKTMNIENYLDSIPLPSEPKIGAEVAPPPTYEYYGPNIKCPKFSTRSINMDEMKNSILIGIEVKNNCKTKKVKGIIDENSD
ncbi:coiled-coil domain-containing protein 174 [Daktulosphaira vitifoliae]|uniref:coiled-coil domain-containing protein 174 n=1 Tax=Daktulosphaira vitifoliae TaxID=58002 RepID=UPI0021A9D688|nr:coiled-coil domain-containing protein 174 [Daktulosphaira vitifoliae]